MSDTDQGDLQNASDGVVSGTHPEVDPLRVVAAPATNGEFNTIRAAIFPVACFKVENIRFDFDSSLVKPELRAEMPQLAKLISEQTEPEGKQRVPPISIFGHADPVGGDDLNKKLSGRRAAAIYGLLTRRTEVWEDLYSAGSSDGKFVDAAPGDVWGVRSTQTILNALPPEMLGAPHLANDKEPDLPLDPDGQLGTKTRERLRRFQTGPKGQAGGLSGSGNHDAPTRKVLYQTYMDFLCVDSTGAAFKVDPVEGFLARHADTLGKGDFQGCGEFNPVLLFSQDDKDRFDAATDKTERNEANGPNRRVMVLLYRPGSKVQATLWPCPRAKENSTDCRKRFFPDADDRRSNKPEEQKFADKHHTFACRFYQRMLVHSPCEDALQVVRIRLFDRAARPLPFAPCVVTQPGKEPRPDRASGAVPPPPPDPNAPPSAGPADQGKGDGFITFRVSKLPTTVNVKWSRPKPGDGHGSPPPKVTDVFDFEMEVLIDIAEFDPNAASLARLKNLGYVQFSDDAANIQAFQTDYKPKFPDIAVDGTLNAPTVNAIKTVHEACDPLIKPRQIIVTQ